MPPIMPSDTTSSKWFAPPGPNVRIIILGPPRPPMPPAPWDCIPPPRPPINILNISIGLIRIPRTPRFSNANQNPVSKPPLISIDVNISLDDVACGNTIPVEVERWNLNRDDNETYELEKHVEYYSLPFGVESGEVVLLTNCGNEATNHTRGDVKVTFRVAEHPTFKRSGLDIHTEKTISLKEALCGFVFNIEHINGKKFVFNSSPGNVIRDGLIKTIPKLGIRRGEDVGNLSIVFHVAYPEKLSEEQVKKLSEIL